MAVIVYRTFFWEKFAASEKVSTFALPIRKGMGKQPNQSETLLKIFKRKIWKFKKYSYLCTPNRKQGLQTASQG
ncbi:hypothetical protein E4631_25670 [Hymenobacter sp. UV11]|nr:hypothetical protein E4631_25670 [Hymenobacter sp. UV11]